jgi:hypothetical protein
MEKLTGFGRKSSPVPRRHRDARMWGRLKYGYEPASTEEQRSLERPQTDDSSLAEVMTPQEERDAAMAAYNAARVEFETAQEQWDAYLATTAMIDGDSTEAGAAFERLKNANEARQDAVDSLWLAWRNRPDTDEPS